jgi:mercuric ion transport protein
MQYHAAFEGCRSMTDARLAEKDQSTTIPAPPAGLFAGAGALVGLTALVSSSCCLVPLALAGLGASGAVFSGLEVLAGVRPYLLGAAAVALVAGWWLFFSRRRMLVCNSDGTCATPGSRRRTAGLLALGSVLIGLAIIWEPYIEPAVLRSMR